MNLGTAAFPNFQTTLEVLTKAHTARSGFKLLILNMRQVRIPMKTISVENNKCNERRVNSKNYQKKKSDFNNDALNRTHLFRE